MKYFQVWFLLLSNVVIGSLSALLPMDTVIKDYHGKEYLDAQQEYLLEWTIDWTHKTLLFNITVRTNGWIGLGFSKDGTMKDADMVVAGVTPDKRPYITDLHADCHRNLQADNKQDWNLLGTSEATATTTVQVSRLIDTCDSEDYPITEDLVYVLWAFGETDVLGYHHHHRGFYKLYLLDPVVHPAPSSRSLPTWRATKRFTLPAKGTSYWCTIHKAPPSFRKHHLIEFRAVLENPHEVAVKHLHHFTLYRCFAPPGVNPRTIFEQLVSYEGEECYLTDHNLIPINLCRTMIYVWALGARPLILPDHVGIPFAESPDEYYMMESHYDNPEASGGITFESGVEATYTERLRPQDGGTFMVLYDLFGFFMIPPGTQSLQLFGHCNPECTSAIFPNEGIDIFAIHSHTHRSGKKVKLHHFRNGQELPWVIKDDNYDYTFQNPRPLQTDRKFLPGDHLTLDCIYDDTWTNETTMAGFRGKDEMCLQILYHTVPIPYSWCGSLITQDNYLRLLGVKNVTWDLPNQERIVTSPALLNGIRLARVADELTEWTKDLRDAVDSVTRSTPQIVSCPSTMPSNGPPQDERMVGYSKQLLMGTYITPVVNHANSIFTRYPALGNNRQFNRIRTCPANPRQ